MDLAAYSGWLLLYRSPSTRAGYLFDLDKFLKWAMARGVQSPDTITYQHCLAYLSERRGAGLSANACRRIVWAIRSWLEFELGPDHPAANLAPPRAHRRRQRCLSAEQLAAVLASCDTATPTGTRDLAPGALMADTGLRSAEVCRLRLADIDMTGLRLSVEVKGGNDGAGVYSPLTAQYLARWLDVRAALAHCPAVFCNLHHGTQLTTSGLRVIMRRIGRAAGLAALSPHDLRRTMATLATLAGAPTRVTQVGGRWSSVAMVETYTASLAVDSFRRYSPVESAIGRPEP